MEGRRNKKKKEGQKGRNAHGSCRTNNGPAGDEIRGLLPLRRARGPEWKLGARGAIRGEDAISSFKVAKASP